MLNNLILLYCFFFSCKCQSVVNSPDVLFIKCSYIEELQSTSGRPIVSIKDIHTVLIGLYKSLTEVLHRGAFCLQA